MFGKWFLIYATKNIEGGVALTSEKFDDKQSAINKYYYVLDKTGTNPATDLLSIELKDEDFNLYKLDTIDNREFHQPEPEPEVEPTEEVVTEE